MQDCVFLASIQDLYPPVLQADLRGIKKFVYSSQLCFLGAYPRFKALLDFPFFVLNLFFHERPVKLLLVFLGYLASLVVFLVLSFILGPLQSIFLLICLLVHRLEVAEQVSYLVRLHLQLHRHCIEIRLPILLQHPFLIKNLLHLNFLLLKKLKLLAKVGELSLCVHGTLKTVIDVLVVESGNVFVFTHEQIDLGIKLTKLGVEFLVLIGPEPQFGDLLLHFGDYKVFLVVFKHLLSELRIHSIQRKFVHF